jgi:hypothetical protein
VTAFTSRVITVVVGDPDLSEVIATAAQMQIASGGVVGQNPHGPPALTAEPQLVRFEANCAPPVD